MAYMATAIAQMLVALSYAVSAAVVLAVGYQIVIKVWRKMTMGNIKYKVAVFLSVALVLSAVIVPQVIPTDDVYGDAGIGISISL